MCNLNDAMMEQTGSEPFSEKWILEQTQDESNRQHFDECMEEYMIQYFKDLEQAMNEHYKELEHGTEQR